MFGNYFSVLHTLSARLEITVLPLKEAGGEQTGNPSILDDVFEKFVNGSSLFKDREALRHDYLPERFYIQVLFIRLQIILMQI